MFSDWIFFLHREILYTLGATNTHGQILVQAEGDVRNSVRICQPLLGGMSRYSFKGFMARNPLTFNK